MFPNVIGGGQRRFAAVFKRYVGYKTFINTVGTDVRRIIFQKIQHLMAAFTIVCMVGLDNAAVSGHFSGHL